MSEGWSQCKITKSCKSIHCKNKIVKITNLLVSTVARNNLNCNLIGRVGCYEYTVIIIE